MKSRFRRYAVGAVAVVAVIFIPDLDSQDGYWESFDADGILPRPGWNFGLVWFYSHHEGIGQEFSYEETSALPDWVSTYRSIAIDKGVRYHIVIEAWPVKTDTGEHSHYYQRTKWWADGEAEPEQWMEFTDVEGSPLPPGEFCVALVSHRSQVEYGPVGVLPLEHRQ